VLSRRLLDIGFALNRAAVFSALSLLLVGSFMAVEWALGGWLVSANHVTSAAVGVALALTLGFSVRFVHRRVEQVVDRLFFRKRYKQEAALLRFAREAPFITDLGTLLQRTVDEVTRHSETGSVAILSADRDGTFGTSCASGAAPPKVDENDPALVALRARKDPVDLHAFTTALSGEYALPMVSRGELIGVLVCGLKRNGDPYAPDEIEALAKLALSVATALDALTHGATGVHAEVLELRLEFAALREDVRRMLDELRAPGSTPAP
jgi:GAF domain-containing protein